MNERRGSHEMPTEYSLTSRDAELALEQCHLQHATSPEQIEGMRSAFARAKEVAFTQAEAQVTPRGIESLVRQLGSFIEPSRAHTWRSTPVTFRSGDRGEEPDIIPHAMAVWAEAVAEGNLSPVEQYYHFEKIHPFEDGNGRVGHCLWAIATYRESGQWPTELPPDVFAGGFEKPQQSAFGEVEA